MKIASHAAAAKGSVNAISFVLMASAAAARMPAHDAASRRAERPPSARHTRHAAYCTTASR